jgi:hypothetical protein
MNAGVADNSKASIIAINQAGISDWASFLFGQKRILSPTSHHNRFVSELAVEEITPPSSDFRHF